MYYHHTASTEIYQRVYANSELKLRVDVQVALSAIPVETATEYCVGC